ncbi:hypothetical protein FGG08_004667 [Glutinoglossum americanum]|uniref:CW-type domain-containing protein n=1 Tax=Glutinoglossum americanum TaxID=1670608 RepID=A0A9P8I8S8_9PEZI|nr:hypothetical protein FGG08_004667 [Glutinoglossum americanum]
MDSPAPFPSNQLTALEQYEQWRRPEEYDALALTQPYPKIGIYSDSVELETPDDWLSQKIFEDLIEESYQEKLAATEPQPNPAKAVALNKSAALQAPQGSAQSKVRQDNPSATKPHPSPVKTVDDLTPELPQDLAPAENQNGPTTPQRPRVPVLYEGCGDLIPQNLGHNNTATPRRPQDPALYEGYDDLTPQKLGHGDTATLQRPQQPVWEERRCSVDPLTPEDSVPDENSDGLEASESSLDSESDGNYGDPATPQSSQDPVLGDTNGDIATIARKEYIKEEHCGICFKAECDSTDAYNIEWVCCDDDECGRWFHIACLTHPPKNTSSPWVCYVGDCEGQPDRRRKKARAGDKVSKNKKRKREDDADESEYSPEKEKRAKGAEPVAPRRHNKPTSSRPLPKVSSSARTLGSAGQEKKVPVSAIVGRKKRGRQPEDEPDEHGSKKFKSTRAGASSPRGEKRKREGSADEFEERGSKKQKALLSERASSAHNLSRKSHSTVTRKSERTTHPISPTISPRSTLPTPPTTAPAKSPPITGPPIEASRAETPPTITLGQELVRYAPMIPGYVDPDISSAAQRRRHKK